MNVGSGVTGWAVKRTAGFQRGIDRGIVWLPCPLSTGTCAARSERYLFKKREDALASLRHIRSVNKTGYQAGAESMTYALVRVGPDPVRYAVRYERSLNDGDRDGWLLASDWTRSGHGAFADGNSAEGAQLFNDRVSAEAAARGMSLKGPLYVAVEVPNPSVRYAIQECGNGPDAHGWYAKEITPGMCRFTPSRENRLTWTDRAAALRQLSTARKCCTSLQLKLVRCAPEKSTVH